MSILLGPLASNNGREIKSIYNTNFEDQIKKIEHVKNRLVVTLATENYSSNLNYLLSYTVFFYY
jgi:cytoplasmic iron level regulating protein YaaA (DUF328/UPF0246 family)